MKIILLGGCPGSGKTTISNYLGVKYKISTIINIDVIKQTIKMFVSDDYLNTTSLKLKSMTKNYELNRQKMSFKL